MKQRICTIWLLLSLCLALSAQEKNNKFTIRGTVYDETGAPMPGVTIYLRDEVSIGTISGDNGTFSIRAFRGDMIVFSFIGYEKVEYLVTEEKKDLKIKITEAKQELDEVVVVGLGSQRKISNVAAVSSIDVKELQQPAASIANLLGGARCRCHLHADQR